MDLQSNPVHDRSNRIVLERTSSADGRSDKDCSLHSHLPPIFAEPSLGLLASASFSVALQEYLGAIASHDLDLKADPAPDGIHEDHQQVSEERHADEHDGSDTSLSAVVGSSIDSERGAEEGNGDETEDDGGVVGEGYFLGGCWWGCFVDGSSIAVRTKKTLVFEVRSRKFVHRRTSFFGKDMVAG